MCTAVSLVAGDHYFGRNLDYEHNFGEQIIMTPRHYSFVFSNGQQLAEHGAILGMGLLHKGYPLYFDGVNEWGLAMAGLYFPGNAFYGKEEKSKENIASFELLPWLLSQCKTVSAAEEKLKNVNITQRAFCEELQPTPLHWMLADKTESVTVEQTTEGLFIYDNPVGVLTNNPPFCDQLFYLNHFMSVTKEEPENLFSDKINLSPYSKGMGGIGLPGDFSSMSRFVRGCFIKLNATFGENETENVNQFFHILHGVHQPKGCVKTKDGYEMTQYAACCNTSRGIYYYQTYYNSTLYALSLHNENINGEKLQAYDLIKHSDIIFQN